jgi:hypothetical protein
MTFNQLGHSHYGREPTVRQYLSRLETSSALALGCGDARCRRLDLDLPSAPLVELGSGSDCARDPRGRGAGSTGQVRHLAGAGERGAAAAPGRDQATRW